MALTMREAEAAAQALRGWPTGKCAYALAWTESGIGYHNASQLARAIQNGNCQMSHLGPAATIAMMRNASSSTLEQRIAAAVFDMRFALHLSPRGWVDGLTDPVALAEKLEQWVRETRAHLRGERLEPAGVPAPSMLLAPGRPSAGQQRTVNLSLTARQVLRALVADPDARLYYDRRAKWWCIASDRAGTFFKVRECTAGWLVREELVDLEPLPEGQERVGTDIRYIPSEIGRRSLQAEEGAGVQPG